MVSGEPLSRQSGMRRIEADRVDHRAGEDMRADLRALLQHDDGELIAALGGKLLQPDRRGEPGRSGADDDDVELHGLALDDFGQSALSSFSRASKADDNTRCHSARKREIQ